MIQTLGGADSGAFAIINGGREAYASRDIRSRRAIPGRSDFTCSLVSNGVVYGSWRGYSELGISVSFSLSQPIL